MYLGLALEIGLAEFLYGHYIQSVRGQVVGHMVCQVDQSNERSLKISYPEVLHQPAVTRLINVHQYEQNLNTHMQR